MKCQMVEQGFPMGSCLTKVLDGTSTQACEVTLKKVTVFSEGEEVLLSPFNKEYSPILINEENYEEAYLVGIAIMAIKNL